MKSVDIATLTRYEELMSPGFDAGFRRSAAISLLRLLPVINRMKHGKTILEERLIAEFPGDLNKRDKQSMQTIVNIQGRLQDLLTDKDNSPSTTFDPAGKATITHQKTLLG